MDNVTFTTLLADPGKVQVPDGEGMLYSGKLVETLTNDQLKRQMMRLLITPIKVVELSTSSEKERMEEGAWRVQLGLTTIRPVMDENDRTMAENIMLKAENQGLKIANYILRSRREWLNNENLKLNTENLKLHIENQALKVFIPNLLLEEGDGDLGLDEEHNEIRDFLQFRAG